jgi:elongator complex protein 2
LRAHSDQVTAVKFSSSLSEGKGSLLSGSANGELCIWQTSLQGNDSKKAGRWALVSNLRAHQGSVNTIASLPYRRIFATAAADSTVKVWRFPAGDGEVRLVCSIILNPRFIPLSIAIGDFSTEVDTSPVFIAVAGTKSFIQFYTVSGLTAETSSSKLQSTLTGHEGWITSLALKGLGKQGSWTDSELWLASASQDKSVRLWRISRCDADAEARPEDTLEQQLSAKVYTLHAPPTTLSITFEALLLGHEDWIYTASWSPRSGACQLLTASADNSLITWEPEPESGIWLSTSRLGEISGQKGATSATGSTGGFWVGLRLML